MSKKPIIVFEGIEGSGKSHHIKVVSRFLDKNNFKFIKIREPGGSLNSEKIRKLILNKKSNLLELSFRSSGTINLNCHVSNEPFNFPHSNNLNLVVKFSPDTIDDNEEFLVLPVGSSQINVSQYIYEMIILSLPIKITHPGVEDGTLKSKTLTMLRDYENNVHKTENKIDPRWDKLKDLI